MRELNVIQNQVDELTAKMESAAERFANADNAEDRASASAEVKSLGDQFDVLVQERDVASAQARMTELNQAWNEVAERRVENGGDLSYRRDTAEIRDASDLEMETREDRTRKAELWERHNRGEQLSDEENSLRMRRTAEDRGFIHFLATQDPEPLERARAQMRADAVTTGSSTSSVPTLISNMILDKMKFTGPMVNICRVERSATASPISYPVLDLTGDAASYVAEGTDNTDGSRLPMNVVTVTANTLRNITMVLSRESLRDAAPSLESAVTDYFGAHFGRAVNKFNTVGTGKTLQPLGVLNTDADNKLEAFGTDDANRAVKTGGATTNPDLDDLFDLTGAVDYAYHQAMGNTGFIMHQKLALILRKTKVSNSDNRYVWETDVPAGQPERFAGFPVWINNACSDGTTNGGRPVAFGNWQYHLIRLVQDMEIFRSDHTHAKANSVAFYGTMSNGGSFMEKTAFAVNVKAS